MPAGESGSIARMTGAQQTMQSWAKVIDTLEEVPEVYQAAYGALVDRAAALPYTVFAPPQAGLRGRRPAERLLCDLGDTFVTLEWGGKQLVTYRFNWNEINSLELGNVLLYSWFSIHGGAAGSSPASLTVDFNEATIRHLQPFFRKLRPAVTEPDGYDYKAELQKLDYLGHENFKFMNFARSSLVAGQRFVSSLYQPAVREPVLTVLGRSLYRTRVQPHLMLLTQQEVVLVAEAGQASNNETQAGKYQGVWCFLPLRHLRSWTLEQQSAGPVAFTFQLADGTQVQKLFDAALLPQLENFRTAMNATLQNLPRQARAIS